MSPAQKKVIDDHCTTEWAEKVAGAWANFEAAGRDKMKKASGKEVYTLTPEQLAAWKKSTEPLANNWAEAVKKVGANPDQIRADLQAALGKYHAGF
jgi:TRAP-type C4-dicarboxylate transport system substrate-binding protein